MVSRGGASEFFVHLRGYIVIDVKLAAFNMTFTDVLSACQLFSVKDAQHIVAVRNNTLVAHLSAAFGVERRFFNKHYCVIVLGT